MAVQLSVSVPHDAGKNAHLLLASTQLLPFSTNQFRSLLNGHTIEITSCTSGEREMDIRGDRSFDESLISQEWVSLHRLGLWVAFAVSLPQLSSCIVCLLNLFGGILC